MRRILTFTFAMVFFAAFLNTDIARATDRDLEASEPTKITPLDHLPALKGDYFKLSSKHVDRPFHIYVRYPEEYDRKPDARYPVVYLTDGDSLFPWIATKHLFMHYDDKLPEAIIVGIAYGSFHPSINKRGFDYSAKVPGDETKSGGAAQYSRFLKSELIPLIDEKYRTDPKRRILFGQSRGGHYVLYSAFTDPDLFWGRIASNPPLDPGRELFFANPTKAQRSDLGLVYASGSNDRPYLRADAAEWFTKWQNRTDAPWTIKTLTIDGGTHAADAGNVYRKAMLWLFSRDETEIKD